MNSASQMHVAVARQGTRRSGRYDGDTETFVAATLGASFSRNRGLGQENETGLLVAATLNSGGNNGGFRTEPGEHLVVGTLSAHSKAHGHGMTTQQAAESGQIIAFTERTRAEGRTLETQTDLAYALMNPGQGGRTQERTIAGDFGVRRLTPTECERLQGFEDGWTAWGIDEEGQRVEMSDSARYRMCGNAVNRKVSAWLDGRIVEVLG